MATEPEIWTQQLWQDAYNVYQRPTEWVVLPIINIGDEKMSLLHGVFDHDSNFCAFVVTGSNGYTVDWGDGTIQNFASGVQAEHIYDFSYAGYASTLTSDGFKQAIVTITPQAGGNLLTANFNVRHSTITTNVYATNWLDGRAAGVNFTSIAFGAAVPVVYCSQLEMFEFIGTNNMTSTAYMFNNCYTFGKLIQLDTSKVTATNNMFQFCHGMIAPPMLDTRLVTTAAFMFNECRAMRATPFYDFSLVTDGTSLFQSCYRLGSVPLFSFGNLQNGSNMFAQCYSLSYHPLYDLHSLTNGTSMFTGQYAVRTLPLFNLSSLTNGSFMFGAYGGVSLPFFNLSSLVTGVNMFSGVNNVVELPLFNLGNLVDGSSMFTAMSSLKIVPLFDFHSLQNGTSMFANDFSLETLPLFTLSALTNGTNMLQNCSLLKNIPLWDLGNLVNGTSMFNNVSAATSLPLFDLHSLVTGTGMFQGMSAMTDFPLFNLSNVTAANNMFNNIPSALTFPLFDFSKVTTATNLFGQDSRLTTIPAYNFAALTDGSFMFNNNRAMVAIPAMNLPSLITPTSMFANNLSVSKFLPAMKATFTVPCKLSKAGLEIMFNNLYANVSAQTCTITGNWGADTAISKASSGTATGSTTVTLANTTSLAVGMRVTGTGIDVAQAVTFQDTGDTVTINTHGIPNDTIVSFSTVVTTTGITVKTLYYVVNSTTNTFQVSLTQGGSPIALTTNGTGTVVYPTYITSISPGINFTISIPAKATGSQTLTFRILDTFKAIAKGWTITG